MLKLKIFDKEVTASNIGGDESTQKFIWNKYEIIIFIIITLMVIYNNLTIEQKIGRKINKYWNKRKEI